MNNSTAESSPRQVWSRALSCQWSSWVVVNDAHLALDLPDFNICDMEGAIKVARYLLPGVKYVSVCVDGKLDCTYVKRSGQWYLYPNMAADNE